jgi:hypothetical protein
MLQKFAAIVAWACLIFIIYATLSSAGRRPELTASEPMLVVFVERFGAYGLLGILFRLAYPNRIGLVWVLVLGSAVVLELLQIFIPTRALSIQQKNWQGSSRDSGRSYVPFICWSPGLEDVMPPSLLGLLVTTL